jgi:lysophospholipase L1-like esterase
VPSAREVRYGVPGAYTIKVVAASIKCNDGAFGVTVATPYQNFCEYSSVAGTPSPAPAPAPTPAPSPSPNPTAPLVTPGVWTVIGSSSAAGTGPSTPANAWVPRLQTYVAMRSVSITNLAVGGTNTYQALPIGSPQVPNRPVPVGSLNIDAALSFSPKLVIVSYPTNDTELNFSVSETVNNILTIRAAALARGVPVLVQGTQPRNLSDAQRAFFPQIDAQLAAAIGTCFVEVRSALAAADGRISATYDAGDGVHVNDAGHAIIYSKIRTVLDAGTCVRLTP